ncbi:hypothetical protein BC835DRAFT_1311505 [Cytidiella melzeri]|nr:hypothetical protein BC835DRAFT_1311505 [Cytidiella melzeri]
MPDSLASLPTRDGAMPPSSRKTVITYTVATNLKWKSTSHNDPALLKAGSKVWWALERLRRAAGKALEVLPSSGSTNGEKYSTESITQCVVVVISNILTLVETGHAELLTSSLDSLFTLAKSTLNVSRATSIDQAFDWLSDTLSLVTTTHETSLKLAERANFLQCISGVFHNLGATLYQAGVCQSKTGDRRGAFSAFRSCIRTFPFHVQAFVKKTALCSNTTLFDDSPSTKHIATVIDRMTYMGICDLFLPAEEMSLKAQCIADVSDSESHAVLGALLEYQALAKDKLQERRLGNVKPQLVPLPLELKGESPRLL